MQLFVCLCVGKDPVQESTPLTSPSATSCISAGIITTSCITGGMILSVVLLLTNLISVVVAVLVTRRCCRNTARSSSPSHMEDEYEQEGGTVAMPPNDIVMNDNPAYDQLQSSYHYTLSV